jgi:hypothetical protein
MAATCFSLFFFAPGLIFLRNATPPRHSHRRVSPIL